MGGVFGVVSREDCVFDLFFGTDYHSHLGTRRGGMAVWGEKGFERSIHNIENSPFRTKFSQESVEMKGSIGIGCISDHEPQPLMVRSHLGNFAITTVGKINNLDALVSKAFASGKFQFLEMSGSAINPTELVAALINQCSSIVEGIRFAQSQIEGSMTMLIMTNEGIYAARDRVGRTPLVLGRKKDAVCVTFESSAYINLGYEDYRELGPGEIVMITPDGAETVGAAGDEMKFCTLMWVYYGYPSSVYEGINVEAMRYRCGEKLAERDEITADFVVGVPDSGTAHAVGYANASKMPFARPLIKYTPTWPRSFMPPHQSQRSLIARMKLIPVQALIKDKSMVVIDDSIVRGTQLRETTDLLHQYGAKEVHIRPACPPVLFGCKYLNFSRSSSELDLIGRQIIERREGKGYDYAKLLDYADPTSQNNHEMVEEIGKELRFTSLRYHRLDDMIESVGIEPCKLCTYCWSGIE